MSSLEELLEPISAETPAGRDVSDEADAFQIGQARMKGRAAETKSEVQDAFAEIVDLATRVLRQDSKDLTIAAWLTEAWLQVEGVDGLGDGLEVLGELIDGFWDDLFPQDAEGRAVAIDFVGGELLLPLRFVEITDWGHNFFHYDEARGASKGTFGGDDPTSAESDDPNAPSGANFEAGFQATSKARYKELSAGIGRCVTNLSSLAEACQTRFEGQKYKPSLSRLANELDRAQSVLSELLAKKLEEDPDPPELEVPMDDPEESSEGSGEVDPAGSTPKTVALQPASETDATRRIVTAARYLRVQNPRDPVSYLLVRALRWGELRAGGSALDVRLLDAPPTDQRTRLKKLFLDADWEGLLHAGEDVMATPYGRGWLDLQRYVSTAVGNLGGPFRGVLDAIMGQLRLLLEDLPELPNKTLMDDTPTANVETREWLARAGLIPGVDAQAGGNAAKPGVGDDDPEQVRSEATYQRAREWAASGSPQQGVELLMRRAQHETSERARFITQAHAASIMVDHGMGTVARPILEDLVEELRTRSLEDWEAGEIVAHPLALLYRCLPADDHTRAQLYEQICKLDPVQAWQLEQGVPATTTAETDDFDQHGAPDDDPPVDY